MKPKIPHNKPYIRNGIVILMMIGNFSRHKWVRYAPNGTKFGRYWYHFNFHARIQRVGQGVQTPPPLRNYKNIRFLSNTCPDPLKTQSYQASIQFWAIIGMRAKCHLKMQSGDDGISHKMLKSVSKTVSKPLCILMNRSFHEGIFPDIWKLANVIPIRRETNRNPLIIDQLHSWAVLGSYKKGLFLRTFIIF